MNSQTNDNSFPPPGWVTNRQAAEMLGVGLETLTCVNFKWRAQLRDCGKCVRHPNGGRCNIYPVEGIERILAAQAEWAKRQIPEGFVDKDGACKIFDIEAHTWKKWINEGKVRCGKRLGAQGGTRVMVYRVEDLESLREELFGEDKLYKDGKTGVYHVPEGWIGRHEACERFGVSITVWWRWEREKKIQCGTRVAGGPKLYRIDDINRMLDEYGFWAPPYPDPDRPGVYRVPLNGRDIRRREAIIDAVDVPLIEGGSCSWSSSDARWGMVLVSSGDQRSVPLRRIIMGVTGDDHNVRHANGDPLDCRRENLVIRTIQQRVRNNRKIREIKGRPPTSQFKGVFWETGTKRWRARISTDGKCYWLGRFRDEIAAAEAYDEAARELFGEHARLNFPDDSAEVVPVRKAA